MYVSSQNRCTSQLGWWTCISIRCWCCQRFSKVCWECQFLIYLCVDGLESWWRQCSSILNPLMFTDNHNMSVLWLASFSVQFECHIGPRKTKGMSPEHCFLCSYLTSLVIGRHKQQQWDKQYSATRRVKTSRQACMLPKQWQSKMPIYCRWGSVLELHSREIGKQ